MQMLSYCCYNCSLHFHCNLNWNLAKTLAKFTLTSKYISDETGDRSFLTVLQLLKLLSGGRMKNRSRNSRIWIIWIFTIIGKRLGMCRQRAGEWALPPLRIFNIQIINIPPVGDSDLGLDWWLFLRTLEILVVGSTLKSLQLFYTGPSPSWSLTPKTFVGDAKVSSSSFHHLMISLLFHRWKYEIFGDPSRIQTRSEWQTDIKYRSKTDRRRRRLSA